MSGVDEANVGLRSNHTINKSQCSSNIGIVSFLFYLFEENIMI